MYEASGTLEGSPTYSKGDIVWVKLSSYWWPGEVINEDDLPGDLLSDFKRPPLAIVKFFDEDSYEYVRNWLNINPYDCPKKSDFIIKGMAGFRAKLSHMAKFPKDIGTAEERTNGNPNILSLPEFLPVKKVNYNEIFGTPSPKKSAKGKVSLPSSKKTPARDSNQPHITHRRFLGNDDYRAYICVQFPGKDRKWDSDDEEIKKLNEEPEKVLSCHSCSFKTKRLEVMILHTKMHIQGIYVTSKRKAKKSKGTEAGSDSESDIVAAKSPKPKQRKKKDVKPKTADVFTNLLEEWDETDEDMEEPITNKKSPKTKKKAVAVEKQLPDNVKEENQKAIDNQDKVHKSITTTPATSTSDTSSKTDPALSEPVKNTQDDIKNCFDFDEEEEDDDFLMPTSTGRKIPRVIPEKPKPSISELLELSQKEDDLKDEKASNSVGDTEQFESAATENGTDGTKKEILKMNQSLNRDLDIDENIENTFKELMAETELPTLDELGQNLKPEQNFHDARTVKFPDKGGTTLKGGATSKGGTSKKRFVTSFEDFEAGFRKLEDEKRNTKKAGGDKEVKPIQMLNVPRIDDGKEETPLKSSAEIIESKGSDQVEVLQVEPITTNAELPEKHPSKKSRTRHSAKVKEVTISESAEPPSETFPSPSVEETTSKQSDILHSVGRRKTRHSDKEKSVNTEIDQQTDVKKPNHDDTFEETTLGSRRKSSRRRTKQFVIEEDSEEIIEITREGDSDVMDSSEEVIHLDEKTRKELAAIDLEIENLKRSLDITESTPEEEECKETSNHSSDQTEQMNESSSIEVDSPKAIENSDSDNCNLLKEMMESTENIEIVQEDDVPKKSHRSTRHSSSTTYLQKGGERRKQLTKHDDKTPSKSEQRATQRTNLKNESPGVSVEDLSSKSTLDVSCTEMEHMMEKSESIVTEPELNTIKGRRGKARAHQKDIERNLPGKEVAKCSELIVDTTKSKIVETLEEPIVSSELVEPSSQEKVDVGSHHKSESESTATEPEPSTTKGRKRRSRWDQRYVGNDLREKEVLKDSEINIDSTKSKTIETLDEFAVSSNEPQSKIVDVALHHREEATHTTFTEVNTDQSMDAQQKPKSTTVELTEQENSGQPEEIVKEKLFATESTPCSKRVKTRGHTKEASQEQTIISLVERASTDMKLSEATVESSDVYTPKSEVYPTKSQSTVPELSKAISLPEVLEPTTLKTRRGRSQKFAKEDAARESTDNVPDQTITSLEESASIEATLDTQKSEVFSTESQNTVPELANASPEILEPPTPKTRRGKSQKFAKEDEVTAAREVTDNVPDETIISLEESASTSEATVVASDLDTQKSEVFSTESQNTVPELANASPEILEPPTPKTRRGRSQKFAKEDEVTAARELTDNVPDETIISLEESASTSEANVESCNLDTQKSKVYPTESQSTVSELADSSPVSGLLEPPTPKTRRGRSQKFAKEDEVTAARELTDNVPDETIISLGESASTTEANVESSDIDAQKSEVYSTESQSIVPELANASPEILEPPTPKTKRGRLQKYAEEDEVTAAKDSTDNIPDQTIISLEESASTDMKLSEATEESSDLDTEKQSAVPDLLEPPTPKTRRGRSQKQTREDEVTTARESIDNIPTIKVSAPKQQVTNIAVAEIAELPTGSVVKLHNEPTSKTRRGKHRKHSKGKEHVQSAEEHSSKLESKPVELPTVEPDITLESIPEVPELTHKTRRSKSRKEIKEREENKPVSQENDTINAFSLIEHVSAEIAKAEIVAVDKEQSLIDIENSTKENETVEPEPTEISSTDPTADKGLDFLAEGPSTEVGASKPNLDVSLPTPKKSRRRKHTEEEQVLSAVADDIPKNEESLPMEVSQDVLLEGAVSEVNEEKMIAASSALEIVGEVKNLETDFSAVSDESNLKIRRGRQQKLVKEQEIVETGSEEANSKLILESIKQATENHSDVLKTTIDKFIEHSTPKSRRSRTRKYAKGEESSSSEKYASQTKPTIKSTESPRMPSFSMPEEPFSKTRRGRSRKLTQEEEDFARAIQESLKDMAQNQVEATSDQTHTESNLTESDKSSADTAVDAFIQNSSEISRKSKKGKSRKNSKSQEHAATVQNEILTKDASLDDTQAVSSTDSNKLQKEQINTGVQEEGMNNTSLKPPLNQPLLEIAEHFTPSARRSRTRKHSKEDQQSESEVSKEPKNTEEALKQINESEIIISETAQDNSLKPAIPDAIGLSEQPTPKSKRGRPRKHAVQEDILLATPIGEPSQIANEIQSKELTAALEFTKTVLDLVENQLTVGNTEAVVEAVTREDTEQKDILIEPQIKEPTVKTRRGRSRRHTQDEEVLPEDIGKTIPSEHADVAMAEVQENSSVGFKSDLIGQETTGNLSSPKVVEQSEESTVADSTLSESKMIEEPPPKPKKGRPRKHIEENPENIIKYSSSISSVLEPKRLIVEPALKIESQAGELDAHMKDEYCVATESSEKDLGSMGSLIQTAVDQSFSTLDHIPKSGLSEWVGELLKISSKEEGRIEANKEEIHMDTVSKQNQKAPKSFQVEVPVDELTVQENTPLESNIASELNIQETTSAPETFEKYVNKRNRRRSKESLRKETAPILENSQTSAEVMQEIVLACAKPELAVEQVLEGQLETVLHTTPDQTNSGSIQAEIDTSTSKKNDHIVIETFSTKESESSMLLVKKNDSAKSRRGRPRKSISSETLPIDEDSTVTFPALQSKSNIKEQESAINEINDADKSEKLNISSHYKLDQRPIPETTQHNDVKSSVLSETVETVPEASVQKSTVTEKMEFINTSKETQTKTTSQLHAAVSEVVKPTILESGHRKGPKTIILNRKRIEMGLQNKAALSASVDAVESSVIKKGYIEPSPIKKKPEVKDAESSQGAFKEVPKHKFTGIVSSEEDQATEMSHSVQEQGPKDSTVKNNDEYVIEDSIEQNDEQAVIQETPHSLEGHIPQSKRSRARRNSKQDRSSLVAPDKKGVLNNTSDQKAGLSEEKSRHVPPKKNRWSRRGSYGKSDTDVDNLLKVVESVPETVASEEVVIDEQTVEINAAVLETEAVVSDLECVAVQDMEKSLPKNSDLIETSHSDQVPRILDNSFADFNDSEIILPPKKSKRASDVKYNFLNDSFASNAFSLEKKADSDILSFPTCDDSIMSTSLRNNIEGLIKDIDNFDSSNVSDNLNITVKDDGEKVAAVEIPKTESAKSDVNLFSSTDSSKCVPPKKKKIEYLKQDVASSFINSLVSNDINKTEEKLDLPQPPKKKIQKLFETSQALEKVGKVSDIPQMSPLAKKKSFLFHPEEFAQKVAEITQQIEVAAMREPEKNIDNLYSTNLKSEEASITLDSKDIEADLSKTSTVPKKRQKRKSSSLGDQSQKKERRTSNEAFDTTAREENNENEPIVSQPQDQKQVLDTVKIPASDRSTPDENITVTDDHKNEMEVKIEEDDFKFCIQTNLTNIATTTAEELSSIATATLSEIKNEVKKEDEPAKQIEVGANEDNVEPEVKEEYTMSHVIPASVADVSSESEFVPISINPTIMSEKDLADAQVEITTDKVISEKKPTNLAMFSMDFLESRHPVKVHTIKIKKTELMGSPKANNTSGTEFTSKAMTKEFDNRALITQPKAYALKSELLDILEGNSNSSTNSSGSDQKFKTSFDNYDKQTVVQGMFDFEDAIPSQIVLSNKVDPETVLIDSPKLLERLSMSNDANKVKSKKVLIQSDVKISENVPKGLVTRITKPMGTPKPGQKILIKTTKAQPLSMSKTTGNKPIILSEQIIRPANVPKPVIQPQGIKRQYEDIEDVETAFIIPKIAKKTVEEEVMSEVVTEKPARGRGSKNSGKAKILQQTIITPKGEIVQSQTPTTTPSTTSALIEPDPPENDDMVFDINSMPIVLSDDLLTPESIQNMPVVLSDDVMSHSKPMTVKAEEKVIPLTLAKKGVSNVTSKQQIVFKTTLSGPTTPLQAKQTTKPRILTTTPASAFKVKPPTALLATGTSVDGKPTKYVLVPSTVASTVPQVKPVKPPAVKKQLPLPPKISHIQTNEPQSPIVGNKIMIVTNQHGQQTRVVLTPQQQKAFIQSQPGSKTKTIIKGAIPKALLESASAGSSGIIQKTQLPSVLQGVPQGITPTVSSQGGLLMTVGKGAKTLVHPKKVTHRTPNKPQKTILIKNQMGQTVRKIQGTDDADLDRQVAEQLEAIKASARLQQANKSPEIINYTNRHIASSTAVKTAVRRPHSKKVEPIKVKPTVPTPQGQSQKPQESLIPALAPLSPQQVHSQTPPNIQKQVPVKLELPPSSTGNKTTDTRLQQQPAVSTKSESKPPVSSTVGAENKPADRPLTQLVIQDGLGNQTTITEGQILAIPSETVDGQPQSYMLVTLDEMGNITPLNNEALMSLDPSLGLGGDLNNMVLQVDQGQGTVAALKPAEPSVPVANAEQNKIAERIQLPQPTPEPKHVPVEQPKPQEVPMAVEQQIVIGEGVLPGADAGGQQLIVTGDPIATQKFLESLSDGSTDLANILANAEGGSVLIQADGQQILIKTNTGSQPLLGISENTEAGGNPIFGAHRPNQDILAAALANTDVFPSSDQPAVHSSPVKGMQSSQLSPSGGSGVLYPMHVSNVLETSLTLSSPIMTPLEVPSIPNKKIDDDVDILNQVPKNVDLPITITDPNISQTVAHQQAIGLMELTLPISETSGSGDINSPNYSYSLSSLEESVGPAQKPFNGSMPLLTEDVTEVESNGSSQIGKIRVAKGLQSSDSSLSPNYGSLPLLPETIESSREEVVKTSCFGEMGSLPMLAEDVIEDSGSSRGSSKPPRSSPKNLERDIVDEGLSTLGGEMCSSLSEPPPDMFDLASITAKEEEISSDMSSIPEPEGETLSLHSENSGEIPIQPPIVANLNDLKRPGDDDSLEQDEKRQKFD